MRSGACAGIEDRAAEPVWSVDCGADGQLCPALGARVTVSLPCRKMPLPRRRDRALFDAG